MSLPCHSGVDIALLPLCSQVDRLVALARMRQSGAFLSTSEGLILQLVSDAAHPQFKKVRCCVPLGVLGTKS